MSDTTHRLGLPLVAAGQAQKHVPVNEALARLDTLVQAAVLDRAQSAPPADAADGAGHIVASGATGAWQGHDLELAGFQDGVWNFLVPQEGWTVWVVAEKALCVFSGGAWRAIGGLA